MSEPTRELLTFYKQELANRPAVEQWRRDIPNDVRRGWIRYMIGQAGSSKLMGPEFNHLIIERLSEAERKTISDLQARIRELEAEEQLDPDNDNLVEHVYDLQIELQTFFQDHTTEEQLQAFAKLYFGSFDTDAVRIEAHHEQARLNAQLLLDSIIPLLRDAPTTAQAMLDQHALVSYHPAEWKALQRTDLTDQVKAIVLVGSGAVGPRRAPYPTPSDLDFYVIPDQPNLAAPAELSLATSIIQSLIHGMRNLRADQQAGFIRSLAPELAKISTDGTQPRLDVHLPEAATANRYYPGDDWRKLTGPHLVLATHTDTWQAAYAFYQRTAIQEAQAYLIHSRQG